MKNLEESVGLVEKNNLSWHSCLENECLLSVSCII